MVGYGLVGGLAAGSTTNSFGTFFLTGGESGFNINVGFGSFVDEGFRFNNPFKKGGFLETFQSIMDWTAVGSDAFKIQKNLNGGKRRGEADVAKINSSKDVYADDGGVKYVEVKSLPERGHAAAAQDLVLKDKADLSDAKTFKIPGLKEQFPGEIKDFRTLWGHYKEGGGLFEFHASRFPTRGLGGLLTVPHVLFESAVIPLYNVRRNYLLPALTFYSRNQAAFNVY